MLTRKNSGNKGSKKPYTHLLPFMVLVLFGALLFTVPVTATEYSGDALTTVNGTSGHVTGGLWYDYYSGFGSGYPGPITKTFNLPCSPSNIEWARLEVVTYIGSSTSNYPIIAKTIFNGGSGNTTLTDATSDSTYSWGTASVNWDPNNNKASRVSSDLVSWYDVKDYISSQTVSAYVSNAQPDGSQPFDGRVKSITLIIAYNDSSTGKEFYYWVNQGHDVCAYTSSPEHIGATTFSTSSVPYVGLANLSALYISSYNGKYWLNGGSQLSWSNPKQGSYWGSTSWNVTNLVTQGNNSILNYTRNETQGGSYSGYFKLPLALLTVENRKFTYDFSDTNTYGKAGTTLLAYGGNVNSIQPDGTDVPTTAITPYSNIASDNNVFETTTAENGYHAAQRFEFAVNQSASSVENLTAMWVGRGNGSSTNGECLYIWNPSQFVYEELQSTTSSDKVTLSGSKPTGLSNYIDSNNKVILLVVQNSQVSSTVETDYVKLEVRRTL
jgi:hypothetical protein